MRVGINGSDKLISPDLVAIATDITQAEADGFASYWMAQTTLLDAISGLAIAASGSSSITVGTAVVPTWTRSAIRGTSGMGVWARGRLQSTPTASPDVTPSA